MINTNNNQNIVVWDEKYATGIQLIDSQHKELFSLTNELFQACLDGENAIEDVFRDTMGRMVDYVRFHFGAEQELLQRVKYPDYQMHKKQHDTLVMQILSTVKEYSEGKKLAPNQFVRTLRDWILGHIAHYDKLYASYISAQIANGLITEKDISG